MILNGLFQPHRLSSLRRPFIMGAAILHNTALQKVDFAQFPEQAASHRKIRNAEHECFV
jgi:hypothetical protein